MKTRNTCCPNEPILMKLDNPLAAMLIIAKHAKKIDEQLLHCIHFKHFFFSPLVRILITSTADC